MLNAGQGIKISYFYFWGWIYVYNIDCFWSLTVKEEFSNEMSGKVLLMNKYLHLILKVESIFGNGQFIPLYWHNKD